MHRDLLMREIGCQGLGKCPRQTTDTFSRRHPIGLGTCLEAVGSYLNRSSQDLGDCGQRQTTDRADGIQICFRPRLSIVLVLVRAFGDKDSRQRHMMFPAWCLVAWRLRRQEECRMNDGDRFGALPWNKLIWEWPCGPRIPRRHRGAYARCRRGEVWTVPRDEG